MKKVTDEQLRKIIITAGRRNGKTELNELVAGMAMEIIGRRAAMRRMKREIKKLKGDRVRRAMPRPAANIIVDEMHTVPGFKPVVIFKPRARVVAVYGANGAIAKLREDNERLRAEVDRRA